MQVAFLVANALSEQWWLRIFITVSKHESQVRFFSRLPSLSREDMFLRQLIELPLPSIESVAEATINRLKEDIENPKWRVKTELCMNYHQKISVERPMA